MIISFTGSAQTAAHLKSFLAGYTILQTSSVADVIIYEVKSAADVGLIPRDANIPIFIYVNTSDKNAIAQLKNVKISGIFTAQMDAEALKRKLDSVAKNYSSAVNSNDFEVLKVKILAKAENVPALPMFAQKLVSLTNSSAATMQEITNQIKMDQGISSKLMRLVNSSFYVVRQQVTSIDRAAVMLGFQTLKNIALAATTTSYYNKQFSMYNTTGNQLWLHAYTTAIIAEELAKYGRQDADTMFLSGLFHDIGKTVMVDFLVKPVTNVEEEQQQLGMDHAEIAGMIVKRWQLPDKVCDAVRLHHKPESMHSKIVYAANKLAHASENLDSDELERELEFLKIILPFLDTETMIERIMAIAQAARVANE